MRRPKSFIVFCCVVALFIGWRAASADTTTEQIKIHGHWPCMEDEVLVGRGDYVGGDGWERWRCFAADDLF